VSELWVILWAELVCLLVIVMSPERLNFNGKASEIMGRKDEVHSWCIRAGIDQTLDCQCACACGHYFVSVVYSYGVRNMQVPDVFGKEGTWSSSKCADEGLNGSRGGAEDDSSVYDRLNPID